jgi:hypothetical protein
VGSERHLRTPVELVLRRKFVTMHLNAIQLMPQLIRVQSNGLDLIVKFELPSDTQATDACDILGGVEQASRKNPDLTSLADLYFDAEKDRQVLNSLVTKGDNSYKLPGDLYHLKKGEPFLAKFTGDLRVESETLSFKFDLRREPQ